jgi:hypothetical protein
VLRITAGNYGGKLGQHHFHLRQILRGETSGVAQEKPAEKSPAK